MKIALLGGTGDTGRAVARVAAARGHEIVAVARRDDETLASIPGVTVLRGDAQEEPTIRALLDDADAVISTIGLSAAGTANEKVFVCTDSVRLILAEFARTTARRLVVVSTHGVNDAHDDSEYARLLWERMGERLVDKERMEQLLFEAPEVDWTIARCPRIIDGPGTGAIRAGLDLGLVTTDSVSREPLAEFLVDQLTTNEYSRKHFSVADR